MWQRLEKVYLPWADYGDLAFLNKGGRWQAKPHIYGSPFYYIDYTLAQCCAMQFWVKSRQDYAARWKPTSACAGAAVRRRSRISSAPPDWCRRLRTAPLPGWCGKPRLCWAFKACRPDFVSLRPSWCGKRVRPSHRPGRTGAVRSNSFTTKIEGAKTAFTDRPEPLNHDGYPITPVKKGPRHGPDIPLRHRAVRTGPLRKVGALELLDHFIARTERLDRGSTPWWCGISIVRVRMPGTSTVERTSRRPLFGVPMTVKESFDVAGLPTTRGHAGLKDPARSASPRSRCGDWKPRGRWFSARPTCRSIWPTGRATIRSTARPTIPGISPARPADRRAARRPRLRPV